MFTGLIETKATVLATTDLSVGRLDLNLLINELQLGESIAVNGVCLTVAALADNNTITFDLSPETLARSNLATLTAGNEVNIERPLRFGQPVGGHWVLGHVDEQLTTEEIVQTNDSIQLTFSGVSTANRNLLVAKGSICIAGVSLTINEVLPIGFSVMIIPHTAAHTTLGQLQRGDKVNVEYDYLAKLVINQEDNIADKLHGQMTKSATGDKQ